MASKKFSDINLYELLGIDIDAEQNEIRKAYRKRALDCHPDKNPDNPKAAERFHELSKALEILTDESARSAYDKILKARKAAELRNRQRDSKRQKIKEELEERERSAYHKLEKSRPYSTVAKSDEELLQEQIDRLRNEGSRLLEEEQKAMREQLQRSHDEKLKLRQEPAKFDSAQHRIKIKWKAGPDQDYTEEQLLKYLKKYGDVVALVINKKRRGRAMVELASREACDMVIAYEKGDATKPLSFAWVTPPASEEKPNGSVCGSSSARDYEDLVMRKLRQAEERKRIIEQMMKDEESAE